jgi:hypothetical protein
MSEMQRSLVGALSEELPSHDRTMDDLTQALEGLVQLVEDTMTLSDRVFPIPDCGCSECMAVPLAVKHNTGLCAFHKAKRLLAPESPATRAEGSGKLGHGGRKESMTNIESDRFFFWNDQELS